MYEIKPYLDAFNQTRHKLILDGVVIVSSIKPERLKELERRGIGWADSEKIAKYIKNINL